MSMNPGTTSRPPASMGFTPGASLRMSSLVPTAESRSPLAAMASAQGSAGSPVYTRALTMTTVTGSEFDGDCPDEGEQADAMRQTRAGSPFIRS